MAKPTDEMTRLSVLIWSLVRCAEHSWTLVKKTGTPPCRSQDYLFPAQNFIISWRLIAETALISSHGFSIA